MTQRKTRTLVHRLAMRMQVTTSTDTPARAKLRYSSPSNTWHTGWFSRPIISGHGSAGQSFQVMVQLANHFRSWFSWPIISGHGSAGQSFQVMVQLANHFRSWFRWSIISGHGSAGQSFQVMVQLVNHFRSWFSWLIISGHGSAGQSFQVMVQLANHFRSWFRWSIISAHQQGTGDTWCVTWLESTFSCSSFFLYIYVQTSLFL